MNVWGRRRMNYTMNSKGMRRSWRRAARTRLMPIAHWRAYIGGSQVTGRQLLHKGGKP